MIALRDYQERCVQEVLNAFRGGYKSVCLVAPTGSGKRRLALWFMEYAAQHKRRVLFLGNRRLLINQAADEAAEHGVEYGTIMADLMQGSAGATNQIASIHTLESWYLRDTWKQEAGVGLPPADLLLIDECVCGESEVLTPAGQRRIDQVRPGDVVFNACGTGIVESVFSKPEHEIYRLEFDDGTVIECTGDHPFFTATGWVQAANLAGQDVFSPEGLRFLWEDHQALGEENREREDHQRSARGDMEEAGLLLDFLCQEAEKPNEQSPVSPEDEGASQGNTTQASKERRERAVAAIAAACSIARTWRGVGGRVVSEDRNGQADQWLSHQLQDRHSEQGQNDRDRAGRGKPLHAGEESAGCQENGLPLTSRVVRVSHRQFPRSRTVFNLRVSGHPSYFVNGRLSHNCHRDLPKYAKLLHFYPEAKVCGFTATPLGPDGRAIAPAPYEVLIEPVLNSELIREGWLLPTTVYAPSEPYLQGVKVTKGEFVQNQLGRAVQQCTLSADIFREWEERGCRQMATVVFVPGVAYGRDLERQFNYYLGGQQAHVIEAKTKPAERESILRGIADRGTGAIISVDVLREGFDLPLLQCAIDLQPNQQLRSYWQKIGRIKRPHAEQRRAIYLDFAGNYWRFPHPNTDPQWPEGPDETSQERLQKQRQEGEAAQPIMCPKCSLVRERGPKCPGCGYENPQAIRRVRMGDGRLKEMPAEETAKRQASHEERMFNKWQQRLYAALYNSASYSQAARIFKEQTGEYPKEGWIGVHPVGDVKWKRHVRWDFDFRSLTNACKNFQERLRGP